MSDILDYMKSAENLVASIDIAAEMCIGCLQSNGTVFFCGNGGSAADSQHFAGEFVGRFRTERNAMPAIAITSNSAVITAIANDYDFSEVFSRQIEALGKSGDVLVAITTSGNSPNVLKAVDAARKKSMRTIGFTSTRGKVLSSLTDTCIMVALEETSHVQEALFIAGHAICYAVEKSLGCSDGV